MPWEGDLAVQEAVPGFKALLGAATCLWLLEQLPRSLGFSSLQQGNNITHDQIETLSE